MKKKILQELIENAKKENKFIYQRYNGIITKYIDYGNFYINCKTGIGIAKDNEHLMLGKVSKNILDLVNYGEIVQTDYGMGWFHNRIDENTFLFDDGEELIEIEKDGLKTILTKELYEANCYKVGGE